MRTIYLDELFCLNLVIDYFLLLGAAKLCALPLCRGRFLAAAGLGGLWSALALLPGLGFLQTPLMHPVLAGFMTLTAFGGQKRLLRCFLAFLGMSALFGGAVYAAGLYRGGYARSGALVRVDLRVLAGALALSWGAVELLFRRNGRTARRRITALSVEKDGRRTRLLALEDSGNGLYDPLTGMAALVADAEAAGRLFEPDLRPWLRGDPAEAVLHIPGLRLMPYRGVDGATRLLPLFRPDRVTDEKGQEHPLLIAVTRQLSGDGYNAIL